MESMEYEQVRNLTLLFFFERLIDKNEPRTLHDLSCQFGAPGFTKEMRQIAGGSESGELIALLMKTERKRQLMQNCAT
jgi:exonuclease 3'-5' domain-containing protein 1